MIYLGDCMLTNMTDILNRAKKGKYAVAQFNINNLEWTKFILEENNRLNVPVILGVSEGAIKYMGGYLTVVALIKNLIQYLGIQIPIVIHLDHGSSFEVCKKAIDAGFTSVMIDASNQELEENINITKSVVDYAHQRNVSVEAEIGHVGVGSTGILYAEVDDCLTFCQATGIDCLAPALGSVHGPYHGTPVLAFDRMKEISMKTNIPLVLHGGSGIYNDQIKKAIACGMCKININTELQQVWAKSVRDGLARNQEVYDPRKIIKFGEVSLKQMIDDKVKLFETKECV